MTNRTREKRRRSPGAADDGGRDSRPGGEGGSRLYDLFGSPTELSEALTPGGLLAITLVLAALLVALITTSVTA